eukprot:72641-Rhodomonas_salina.2
MPSHADTLCTSGVLSHQLIPTAHALTHTSPKHTRSSAVLPHPKSPAATPVDLCRETSRFVPAQPLIRISIQVCAMKTVPLHIKVADLEAFEADIQVSQTL